MDVYTCCESQANAKENKLSFTKMINKAGKAVAPGSDSVQSAAASADWNSVPGFGVILANQPGDQSWPMAAATWILMYKKPEKSAEAAEALKFFAWAYAKGGAMADSLDYVPMPQKVVTDIMKMWSADIKDASGKPLYSPTN